ncbi:hypothetical protein FHS85_001896 [Rhodoligotrophos appendicifer]|uniref:hypothetical protein n=1 Tax=Rhodoligotrophos appendicifer TaxID=987056 RepID=UPI00118554DA|nr:hypothetical protein [Rhodoligotrophos appendicifer]
MKPTVRISGLDAATRALEARLHRLSAEDVLLRLGALVGEEARGSGLRDLRIDADPVAGRVMIGTRDPDAAAAEFGTLARPAAPRLSPALRAVRRQILEIIRGGGEG